MQARGIRRVGQVASRVPRSIIPAAAPAKIGGFELYKALGSPKYLVSPMVNASKLAFRLLCRRHGAQLCCTPMLSMRSVVSQKRNAFRTHPDDQPLIVQIGGDDPEIMARAAVAVQDVCAAIDVNFGCPQKVARKGHYGAYLLEEPDLAVSIIDAMHRACAKPITCKVRVLDNKADTLALCRRFQHAGAQMITVHGRTRNLKAQRDKGCDWDIIKAVKESLDIPVFANGGVGTLDDVQRCMEYTGVDGVMVSEAILERPALFQDNKHPDTGEPLRAVDLAVEMADICVMLGHVEDCKALRHHCYYLLRAQFQAFPSFRAQFNAVKWGDAAGLRDVLVQFQRALLEHEQETGQHMPFDTVPTQRPTETIARDIANGMSPGLAHGSQSVGLAYYMRHRTRTTDEAEAS